MRRHLAWEYLGQAGEELDEYDGMCGELADQLMKWLDTQGISYELHHIDFGPDRALHAPRPQGTWRDHTVVVVDGQVHDAWWYPPLPLLEYLEAMFPGLNPRVERYDEEMGELVYVRGPTRQTGQ